MSANPVLTRHTNSPVRLLLTAREAAVALSISERTLWELAHRGDITPIRIPGRGAARSIRYAVDDLKMWIRKQKGDGQAANSAAAEIEGTEIDHDNITVG